MHSPFPHDRLPSKKEFFGRNEELGKIRQTIEHGGNLLIHSKRRMGKSALARHFLESLKAKQIAIYVDIFDITSKEAFAKALLKALANAQKGELKTVIKKLATLFKRVRIEPTIDPNTLEYAIKPVFTTLSFEEMMEDFFNGITTLARENPVVVAIDEFQQIAAIDDVRLDALLRKQIQQRENTSYIFLGSKRHLLTSLFEYKAPLYEMATHFELPPLKLEEIEAYVLQHLDIDRRLLELIYEKADGETRLMQNIFHLLYLEREKPVSESGIEAAITEIIASKDASFRMLYDTLSNNQKAALKIIGKQRGSTYGADILREYDIKKQTLQSAIQALQTKELIDKEHDRFFLPDRTFELWVKQL